MSVESSLSRIANSLEEISGNIDTMKKILSCVDDKLGDLEGIRKEMDTLTTQVYNIANK